MTNHTIEIGKTLTVAVDTTKLNDAVMAHVVRIGVRNILMDAHASVKRDDCESDQDYRAKSLAQSMKKLEAMYRGEVRANATTRISNADPIEAEALRMARVFVGKATRGWEDAKGDARKWIDAAAEAMQLDDAERPNWTADDFADKAKAVLAAAIKRRAAREDVREAARKVVEAAKSVVATGEDLGL